MRRDAWFWVLAAVVLYGTALVVLSLWLIESGRVR
jgi:hypothetical protein